jgi:mannose-1-phosphate guanylyltransferase
MIVPVILSGGSGTRLWPLSTAERPKQFLSLLGEDSLFKQTISRVADRERYDAPIVVANASHEELCTRELSDVGGAMLLLEPVARNTAVAIAMAAHLAVRRSGPETIILVMPSDHVIGDAQSFHEAVQIGTAAAQAGRLVTFGICPAGPETGYGYLEAGGPVDGLTGALQVRKFTEKPDRPTAAAMLAAGNYLWNGGIFLYRADVFLDEIDRHAPDIAQSAMAAIECARQEDARVYPSAAALEHCPNLSVDYAVMERSDRVATVPLNAGWSDVGSWDALAEVACSAGDNDLITRVNSSNCYVRSDGLKVGLLGVDDLLVVAVGDRVVIMRKGHSQDVRELAARPFANAG